MTEPPSNGAAGIPAAQANMEMEEALAETDWSNTAAETASTEEAPIQ